MQKIEQNYPLFVAFITEGAMRPERQREKSNVFNNEGRHSDGSPDR